MAVPERFGENGKEKSSDEQSPSSQISNSNEFLQISPHSRGLTSDQFDLLHEMILTKHENLSIRYKETFACLEQTFGEVNLLHEENLKLRAENLDLSTLVAAKEKEFMSSVTEDELVSDFSQFGLGAYSERFGERERTPRDLLRGRRSTQKIRVFVFCQCSSLWRNWLCFRNDDSEDDRLVSL